MQKSRNEIVEHFAGKVAENGALSGRSKNATISPTTGNPTLDAMLSLSKAFPTNRALERRDKKATAEALSFKDSLEMGKVKASANKALSFNQHSHLTAQEKSLYDSVFSTAYGFGLMGIDDNLARSDALTDHGFVEAASQLGLVDNDAFVTDGTGLFSDAELEEQNMNIYGNVEKGYPSVFDQPTTAPAKSFDLQSFIDAKIGFNMNSLLGPQISLSPALKNHPTPTTVNIFDISKQKQKNALFGKNKSKTNAKDSSKGKASSPTVSQNMMNLNTQFTNFQRQERAQIAAQSKKEEEQKAAKTQQHMNNYSKAQAAAHQKSQEAHNNAAAQHGTYGGNVSGEMGFEGSPEIGASRADAPHNQTGKNFGGKTGPSTGMLGTTDGQDVISSKTGTHNLSGGAAKDTLGGGRNSRDIGRANAERASAIGNLNSNNQKGKQGGPNGFKGSPEMGSDRNNGGRSMDPSDMSDAQVSGGLGKGKGNAVSVEPAFGRALGFNRSAVEIEAGKRGIGYDPNSSNTGGGTAGGERVICTELLRQGMVDRLLYDLDIAFSQKYIHLVTMRGYHSWAVPLVLKMRKSKRLTTFIHPFAIARAEEISYQMGYRPKGNFLGKIVRLIGEPLCFAIGLFSQRVEWKTLYNTG